MGFFASDSDSDSSDGEDAAPPRNGASAAPAAAAAAATATAAAPANAPIHLTKRKVESWTCNNCGREHMGDEFTLKFCAECHEPSPEARREESGKYAPGRVVTVHGDGYYDIAFSEDGAQVRIEQDMIRPQQAKEVHEKIEKKRKFVQESLD